MFIGLHQKFYFGAPTILFDCLKAALFRDHTVIATLFRNHTIIGPLVQKLHSHGINSCGVVLDKLSEILHGHYHEIVSCTVEPHCVEVK